MVSKDDGRYVVYPHYFDLSETRPLRRVAKSLAIRSPTSEEVANASLSLKLKPVLEKGRAHPSRPWERRGRVLVEARGSKAALLQQIGARLREMRGTAATAAHAGKP